MGISRSPSHSGEWGQGRRSRLIQLGVRIASLGVRYSTVLQVSHAPLVPPRLLFLPREKQSHFWTVFGPIIGTSISITNHITDIFSTASRVSGTTHDVPRFTRYFVGMFSSLGGRSFFGHLLSLRLGEQHFNRQKYILPSNPARFYASGVSISFSMFDFH